MLGMENAGGVILDLDGTLVDSVYQQVVAWRRATGRLRDPALGLEDPPQDRHER